MCVCVVCTYLASVFALFTACAQETVVQFEIVAKTGLLQLRFALAVRNYRNVHFLLGKIIINVSVDRSTIIFFRFHVMVLIDVP